MKVDVDGGELEVLRGAAEILRHQKPHLIVRVTITGA